MLTAIVVLNWVVWSDRVAGKQAGYSIKLLYGNRLNQVGWWLAGSGAAAQRGHNGIWESVQSECETGLSGGQYRSESQCGSREIISESDAAERKRGALAGPKPKRASVGCFT